MNTETLEQYIQSGNAEALAALLNNNRALAKNITSYKVSPLMLACYYKNPALVSLLLKYLDSLTIFEAAAIGKFDAVAHLIYTYPQLVNQYSADGFTALGLACYFGQFETARFLVLKGADVNAVSNNGYQVYPIHSAVASNNADMVRMLIENGAQVNVKQQSGVTPLHTAAQNGNLEILILLLENDASVDVRMEGGKLPADLAREKGYDEIARILSN